MISFRFVVLYHLAFRLNLYLSVANHLTSPYTCTPCPDLNLRYYCIVGTLGTTDAWWVLYREMGRHKSVYQGRRKVSKGPKRWIREADGKEGEQGSKLSERIAWWDHVMTLGAVVVDKESYQIGLISWKTCNNETSPAEIPTLEGHYRL